jgi:hypothetical protein
MTPPWVPTIAGSLDTSQFDEEFTSMLPIGKISLKTLMIIIFDVNFL